MRSRILSHARLVAFLLLIGAGVLAELRPGAAPLVAAALFGLLFVALIVAHQRVRSAERWWQVLRDLSALGLRRLDRDWAGLPPRRAPDGIADHAQAEDLDLFGSPAVGQLLGPTGTPAASRTLAEWLTKPAGAVALHERQAAVAELAPQIDLRDELAGRGQAGAEVPSAEIERFLGWAEDGTPQPGLRAMRVVAFLVPAATVAFIVADATGIVGPPLWIFTILAAAAITFGPGRVIGRTFRRAFGREGLFRAYPEMLETANRLDGRAPALQRLRDALTADGVSAHALMDRLRRLMHLADVRHSGSVYIVVQLLLLWDVHVMWAVERWRAAAGSRVRGWLDALGELEALSAFATLAHDHPDWCFPEIDDAGPPHLIAEALGHPMIPGAQRVDNDVEVGPPGSFLLITGSNMSGKSTLLRAIGANAALALAGAPACARRLRLPVVSIRTSIRIADSVVRGVSYFMAQLERMREIVYAAEAARETGRPVLYLLDEILQGTNTAERRIAATHVIRHLVDVGAIGAVTTHDLELADEPSLRPAVVPVHFTETIVGHGTAATMTFDYRLRPGVATSTNALRLMEIVGLGSVDGG